MKTVILKGRELFAAGVWNDRRFSEADLDSIVDSFKALNLAGSIPLKLGHVGEDPRDRNPTPESPEKQFSMGWVNKIYRDGKKLLGDLEVPTRIADLLEEKFLKFVSIELLKDVRAHNKVIPWVLDAVALLGTQAPAVGILKDLQAVTMRHRTFQAAERFAFTRKETNPKDDDTETVRTENRYLVQELVKLTFEQAVGAGLILPNVREKFFARHGDDGTLEEARQFIKDAPKPNNREAGGARVGNAERSVEAESAGAEVVRRTTALMEEYTEKGRKISYVDAAKIVFKRDPDLTQRYLDEPERFR
jgi:hypothetical protein